MKIKKELTNKEVEKVVKALTEETEKELIALSIKYKLNIPLDGSFSFAKLVEKHFTCAVLSENMIKFVKDALASSVHARACLDIIHSKICIKDKCPKVKDMYADRYIAYIHTCSRLKNPNPETHRKLIVADPILADVFSCSCRSITCELNDEGDVILKQRKNGEVLLIIKHNEPLPTGSYYNTTQKTGARETDCVEADLEGGLARIITPRLNDALLCGYNVIDNCVLFGKIQLMQLHHDPEFYKSLLAYMEGKGLHPDSSTLLTEMPLKKHREYHGDVRKREREEREEKRLREIQKQAEENMRRLREVIEALGA